VLFNDVPHGKIIQAQFSTQPLKMLPGFPVPIPEIVFLTAGPIFPVAFDFDLLKILDEDPAVIPHKYFQSAGFCEIEVCPVCCSVFGWWQWHLFDYVLVDFLVDISYSICIKISINVQIHPLPCFFCDYRNNCITFDQTLTFDHT
jgi:hypothetical protein